MPPNERGRNATDLAACLARHKEETSTGNELDDAHCLQHLRGVFLPFLCCGKVVWAQRPGNGINAHAKHPQNTHTGRSRDQQIITTRKV